MFRKRKKDVGFTLIELLSVIVVLAIVLGFTAYVAVNLVENSKEKSYKVTINEIEQTAGNYVSENSDRLFYVADPEVDNIEYQCITVESLIDTGYFNEDVLESKISENTNVELDDYVYIERNSTTKSIVKTKYLVDENTELCDGVINAIGDVVIIIDPIDYSAYKEITLVYKVKNYYNIDDYSYEYSYDVNESTYNKDVDKVNVEVISDNGNIKKLRVTDNGTITGYIKHKDGSEIAKTVKEVTNIDKTPPTIVATDIVKIYGSSFDLYEGVTIEDNSKKEVSSKVFLGNVEITSSDSLMVGENIVRYEAVDAFGNSSDETRTITLVMPDKEFDYLEEDQIYPVEADGTYIIEAYGAQGGNNGGKGGYVKAEIDLKVGDKLIINTGGINGYNGGGGFGNSKYNPGGGATTVRLNDNYLVIAAGGGATGSSGTGSAGGTGDGKGGADVGAGAGIDGINGSGGSSSIDYSYEECDTCGGECTNWEEECDTCHGTQKCNCRWEFGGWANANNWYQVEVCDTCTTSYSCNCQSYCASYESTYSCNCETSVVDSKSGSGGTSKVSSSALMVENISGNNQSNGHAKVSYKLVEE